MLEFHCPDCNFEVGSNSDEEIIEIAWNHLYTQHGLDFSVEEIEQYVEEV